MELAARIIGGRRTTLDIPSQAARRTRGGPAEVDASAASDADHRGASSPKSA